MPLGPGSRIGSYEITALVGEGGMGRVWRARDTALRRDIAIKTLPDAFALDPDRLARFQREAQALASLNHPNIAQVHGLETVDPSAAGGEVGLRALVMEFVDGETLADRITRGPVPVDDALAIARQIADALDAAHEQGIVHRDLKPANVKLRPDGVVKVLDFGLAKAMDPAAGFAAAGPRGPAYQLSHAPTLTTPAMTQAGMILGTAAYMSPEQARGKAVDRRTDIWALGCVLYEMLTGQRPFDGDDTTTAIASVIKSDPDWAALPAETPSFVRTVLRQCLEKEPRQRIRDAGDLRLMLDGRLVSVERAAAAPAAGTSAQPGLMYRALPWLGGLAVGAALAAVAWSAMAPNTDERPPQPLKHLAVTLPATDQMPSASGTMVAISPDGQTLVYRAVRDGVFRLYLRSLRDAEARPIGEANVGESPFFSPDGRWLAYTVNNTLKRVPVTGGPSQTIAEGVMPVRGGAWSEDGTIIFGTGTAIAPTQGLFRVSDAGGSPELLLRTDGTRLFWYPQLLQGGGAILFTSSETRPDAADVQLFLPATGERRTLLPGSGGRVLLSGHLVFERESTLWAVGFDLGTLTVRGEPVAVAEGLRVEPGGAQQFAVADDGTLVFLRGRSDLSRRLYWVNRRGEEERLEAPPRRYFHPRISPEGDRIAMEAREEENDIWVWHLTRKTLTRLTFGSSIERSPRWTADGRNVLFSSPSGENIAGFRQAADGSGQPERIGGGMFMDNLVVSPDGKQVVFRRPSTETLDDIFLTPADGASEPVPLLQTKFTERHPEISPDGRWIAYVTDESGANEVYVRPFPRVTDGRWQISNAGGSYPLWNPRGDELLYVAPGGTLMAVAVQTRGSFSFGPPLRLLDLTTANHDTYRSYDVSPDGRRVLVSQDEDSADRSGPGIHVILNLFDELRRLVPVN